MKVEVHLSWLYSSLLLGLVLLYGIVATSCSSQMLPAQTLTSQRENPTLPIATSTLLLAPTVSPTEKIEISTAVSLTPTLTPTLTPNATVTPFKPDVNLRITYFTSEYDSSNELVKADVWVLSPPYQSPQLIYTMDKSNYWNLQPYSWAHDGRYLAFMHIVSDENHVALSVLDTQTGNVTQLTETILLDADPYSMYYIVIWSFDDQWLYLEMAHNAINARIVNVHTKDSFPLNRRTQDRLISWSPIRTDEYAYNSITKFPEMDGNQLCISKVGQQLPLKCIDAPEDQILQGFDPGRPLRSSSSWSLDWQKSIISAGIYSSFMLDIQSKEWKPFWHGETENMYYYPYWAPNGQWVLGYGYNKGLYLFNTQNENPQLLRVSSKSDTYPLGWLLDSNTFIYRSGYVVYASSADHPDASILVEDFTPLLKDMYYAQIDLLTSSLPNP